MSGSDQLSIEWKSVVGREGKYEVSRCGQVRKSDGRILKQWLNRDGYCMVRLSNPRKIARAHRLVAEAFCENPTSLPFVNHRDCDRANNHADNLEWCTQWENLAHSDALGRMQRDYWIGKRSPNARLDDTTAAKIRDDYSNGGVSWETLGKRFNVSKRSIGRIVRGESYV